MKRIFASLLLLLPASFLAAAPYSHLSDINQMPPTRFLAQRLLQEDTITFCVVIPEEEKERVCVENVSLLVQSALREWTYGIALHIYQAGRAEEMQDILQILEKPLTLQPLPQCNLSNFPDFAHYYPQANAHSQTADITFILSAPYCTHLSGRYNSFFDIGNQQTPPFICLADYEESPVQKEDPAPQIYKQFGFSFSEEERFLLTHTASTFAQIARGNYNLQQQRNLWTTNRLFEYDGHSLFSIITHELGHAFGLADEYVKSRPEEYASRKPGQGLMRDGYQPISCDEVDGMITLLDRFAGKQRTFASFCSENTYIVNGTEKKLLAKELAKQISQQIPAQE